LTRPTKSICSAASGEPSKPRGRWPDATVDERRAVQVTLLGEVARNYISLRALQRRLAVAQANLQDQQKTLDVVQRRLKNGLAANFDLVRRHGAGRGNRVEHPAAAGRHHQTMTAGSVLGKSRRRWW